MSFEPEFKNGAVSIEDFVFNLMESEFSYDLKMVDAKIKSLLKSLMRNIQFKLKLKPDSQN